MSTSATLNCFAVSAMALTRTHKTTCKGWKHVHGNRFRRRSKDINFQLPPVSISHNTTPKDHLQNKGKTKPFNIKRTDSSCDNNLLITYTSLALEYKPSSRDSIAIHLAGNIPCKKMIIMFVT